MNMIDPKGGRWMHLPIATSRRVEAAIQRLAQQLIPNWRPSLGYATEDETPEGLCGAIEGRLTTLERVKKA